MQISTRKHIFIGITLVEMKLWPIKDNVVVRQLPALPGVIANAFQCNGCVRMPNFDFDFFSHGNGSRSPLPVGHKNIGIKVILTKIIVFVSQM